MAKSLQDQLLGAGLANRKQAVKAKKAKNHKQKLQRESGNVTEDEAARLAREAQDAKIAKDRELNRQRDELATKKAEIAQVKQIIEHARQQRPKNSELAFNFTDGSAVKYIHVNEDQQRHLSKGFLAIARLGEQYELIPAAAAEKIASRDESVIVTWHKDSEKLNDDFPGEEDPYKDFEIPDDLMW